MPRSGSAAASPLTPSGDGVVGVQGVAAWDAEGLASGARRPPCALQPR